MATPELSFIVAVLNGERDIRRCLLSLRNVNLPTDNYEIFVIDNGSKDATQQIVFDFGVNLQIIPGATVGALRNYGARVAQGDYLAFVDADVEVMPWWVQGALKAFEKKSTVASGCFPRAPTPATWVQRTWEVQQCGRLYLDRQPRRVSWLPSMNLVVRRDVFLQVKGFDEDLVTTEDVDLCYRLGKHGDIVENPAMEAVHWGEAADLRTFWRKEVWRGMGSLKGVVRHGVRLDEVPSIAYPFYLLGLAPLVATSIIVALNSSVTPIIICVALLLLPAFGLAGRTCWRTRQFYAMAGLVLLYFLYGIARAFSFVNVLAGKLPSWSGEQGVHSLHRH